MAENGKQQRGWRPVEWGAERREPWVFADHGRADGEEQVRFLGAGRGGGDVSGGLRAAGECSAGDAGAGDGGSERELFFGVDVVVKIQCHCPSP